MNVGKLNRRITLETATNNQSSTTGENTQSWVTLATVWAMVEMKSGKEADNADQIVNTQKAVFTIRMRSDISTVDTRIVYDSDTYELTAIHEDTDKRKEGYLIIQAYKQDNT